MGSEIYSHKIISKWNPASATIVWADWSGTLCRVGCQNTATPESVSGFVPDNQMHSRSTDWILTRFTARGTKMLDAL